MPLADLDAAVRRGTGLGLEAVLAALGGPLRNRPARAASLAAARAALIANSEASPLNESCPWYARGSTISGGTARSRGWG